MQQKIKNIIFDLGGVIVNINHSRTHEAFLKLAHGGDLSKAYTLTKQSPIFDKFECGHLTPEQFRVEISTLLGISADTKAFDEAWSALLVDFPRARIELLQSLSERFHLFLLSNTNAIHVPFINSLLQHDTGHHSLDKLFTKVYFSHVIRKRKPTPEAYLHVLEDSGLIASESLFVDDLLANVEGARAVGMEGLHLTNGDIVGTMTDWERKRTYS